MLQGFQRFGFHQLLVRVPFSVDDDIIFKNTGKRKYNLGYPKKQEQSGGNAAYGIAHAVKAGGLSGRLFLLFFLRRDC